MLGNMVPWNRKSELEKGRHGEYPLMDLHREMNRLFENFFGEDFELMPSTSLKGIMPTPKFDVSETDNNIEFTVELAGVDEKDLDVSIDNNVLIIKGEKKEETKDDKKEYHVTERRYGSFQRSFALPDGVDTAKTAADLKNGVLKVTIPKLAEAKSQRKKIKIQS